MYSKDTTYFKTGLTNICKIYDLKYYKNTIIYTFHIFTTVLHNLMHIKCNNISYENILKV